MRVPNLRNHPSNTYPAGCACSGAQRSRLAARPAPARLGGRISLGTLTSATVLIGLMGGLGYGAHAVLQDLQRVGFAPMQLGPEIVATAPLLARPASDWVWAPDPDMPTHEWDGFQPPAAPARLTTRDGPISAIDPETSGLFEPRRAAAAASSRSSGPPLPDGPNGGMRITLSPDEAALAEPMLAIAREVRPPEVLLHATDETWIRVRDGEAVIFEGVLEAGSRYEVPGRAGAPLLRTGNAGALYALIDGTPYGPIGSSRVVVSDMSLRAGDISGRVSEAAPGAIRPGSGGDTVRSAEASVGQ